MTTLVSPGVSPTVSHVCEFPADPSYARHADVQYLSMVRHILDNGAYREDLRTGTPTRSVFSHQMRFDLRDGTIPLLTTKKMFTRGVIIEILWYLSGSDNIKYLLDNNVHIWDEWAKEDGSLGPVYGVQWRKWRHFVETNKYMINSGPGAGKDFLHVGHWEYVDQIAQLIHNLKTNPYGRRLIVSAWNVAELPEMGLPPCHYAFQCYARPLSDAQRAKMFLERTGTNPADLLEAPIETQRQWFDQAVVPRDELSLMLNQRSCDVALGVPFNIVQYSILTRMIAHVVNMVPGEFIWNGGDVHIYENHVDGLNTQLTRTPYPSPSLKFTRDVTNIDDFKFEDFIIEGYESHEKIHFDVAV